jgi:hypothetical protein
VGVLTLSGIPDNNPTPTQMKATIKQQKRAVRLYEKTGPSAVYDYANELGIDEWSECSQCEAETPDVKNGSCLLCGHPKTN